MAPPCSLPSGESPLTTASQLSRPCVGFVPWGCFRLLTSHGGIEGQCQSHPERPGEIQRGRPNSGSRRCSTSFANFDIRIEPEDVRLGSRRRIGQRGWRIAYRIDPDDAGLPSLEFYATHRMTNDRHVRIWADGHVDHLDAIDEFYGFDPKGESAPDLGVEGGASGGRCGLVHFLATSCRCHRSRVSAGPGTRSTPPDEGSCWRRRGTPSRTRGISATSPAGAGSPPGVAARRSQFPPRPPFGRPNGPGGGPGAGGDRRGTGSQRGIVADRTAAAGLMPAIEFLDPSGLATECAGQRDARTRRGPRGSPPKWRSRR